VIKYGFLAWIVDDSQRSLNNGLEASFDDSLNIHGGAGTLVDTV
jgi:hypothetical protein